MSSRNDKLLFRYVLLTVIFFAGLSLAQESICERHFVVLANPNELLDAQMRTWFPGTKPGTRSRAYKFWRNRSFLPDGHFDWIFSEPSDAVKIGGYIVGTNTPYEGKKLSFPETSSLSQKQKAQLKGYFLSEGTLLKTTKENLKAFDPVLSKVIREKGSVESFLKELGIDLKLTSKKKLALKNGSSKSAGGKYIIDTDGNIYFLTHEELETLAVKLGLEDIKHGTIGALILAVENKDSAQLLDYGYINVRPSEETPVELSSLQHTWNSGKEFDSLQFMLSP